MGRSRRTVRRKPGSREVYIDATPQRLAKGDQSEWINPAEIDSSEQAIGRTRRFCRVNHLDRWHRSEVITQRQWWAGDAYRQLHESIERLPRVVAAYGERTTGGENDYGMARTAAQARRRTAFRTARGAIPADSLGLLDRFLLRNAIPDYRGRAQAGAITIIRQGLDRLAEHFENRRGDDSLDQRNKLM